jgi:hypothetical protein
MAEYYFVNAALPPLAIGAPADLSFFELRQMLQENLSVADLKKVARVLMPIDIANMRAFWRDMPLDERGNWDAKELEEMLLVKEGLPDDLVDFLDRYDSKEMRLRYFSSLYASLYRDAAAHEESPFLKSYYQFERELRLVLLALRAKQTGKDVVGQLQFEDLDDPLVAGILAQKDAPEYIPPVEYEDLKQLFLQNVAQPQQLHRAVLEYRFRKIEEMTEGEHFSVDRILSYLTRLLIVESWNSLDRDRGNALIEDLSRYG